jgi:hypothetical protein
VVAITATNSTTQSVQSSLGRARVEQARREADQAEATARDLRAQADDAEQQADKSQDNLRQVVARVRQEEITYKPKPDGATSEVPPKVQKLIEQLYSATSAAHTLSGNPLKTNANAAPVVNAQGQSTGRILNISA